ncbi:MAG: proton-conducting transporter membrane subunit, partial [Candidatus Omnitrophica bacterium]|nr:proton-conducting transporter membrane subunit [Candidatus Omnitrophota bacterium]
MNLILLSLGLLCLSGFAALVTSASPRWTSRLGSWGAILSCLIGLVPAVKVLGDGPAQFFKIPWGIPLGSFDIALDALSAFFLLPVFVLSALAALYGQTYMAAWAGKKPLGPVWLFFNLLVASMVVVTLSRNGILFLMAWEIMTLASFFLVTFEDERAGSRRAGWIYLVAAHIGTAFLLALFVMLSHGNPSLDFDRFNLPAMPEYVKGILLILAVIGFGTKAGFIPLHVWLPEAHPAAPSHVSSLMSGVMIKMGIYGLVRMVSYLGVLPVWWGWLLIGIGLSSGILGVLFALAQHDLKRLLAYHSVENIGIIALGLGVGYLGLAYQLPLVAVLGFAGGLLHVINHALFKGLLFFGAGAVAHVTGTREIDSLGGCLKRMPWTGVTFLIGAAAIAGLPPLNGFVSEFLIYFGAFRGASSDGSQALAMLAVIGGLALIGGLASACFAKAFGIIFLGEPRTDHARAAHEVPYGMRIPMALLAAGCVGVGLGAPLAVKILIQVLPVATGLSLPVIRGVFPEAVHPLNFIVLLSAVLIALAFFIFLLRHAMLTGRHVQKAGTWDCGYAKPGARMQYTASSFADPLTGFFGFLLRTRRHLDAP